MSTCISEAPTPLVASEHEEQIWLLQQQNPERVNRCLRAWKLDKSVDTALLARALEGVVETIPDLNARYYFSDEGDLQKFRISEPAHCLEMLEAQADDLMAELHALRDISWDAATQPPFKAWIILAGEDRLLAIVHHPILDQTCRQEDILAALHNGYQKRVKHEHSLILTEVLVQGPDQDSRAKDGAGEHGMGVEQIGDIILSEFRSALADPDITPNDDFFDRGGHSLVATRIIGKLASTYGIKISFNDFFRSPTVAALAACAVVSVRDDAQDTPSDTSGEATLVPLTLAQTFLWHAYAECGFSAIFNLPFVMRFLDPVDEDLLFEAFNDLLERHPGLRTTFHMQNGEVHQRVIPDSELDRYKWFWRAAESKGVTLADEASYVFDLAQELPIRIRFIPDAGDGNQILSFLVHHMVIDEWSLNTLMKELAQAYLARASGTPPVWEASAQSISDFALWQKKQGINQEHVDYWVRMLRDATRGLHLDDSANQPTVSPDDESLAAQWLELVPEPGTYERLSAVAKDHQSSLFGVVYTSIALALCKLGNLKDLVIGTSASGRTVPEFFDTVGYFTTMVAHRVQFFPHQSVGDLIREVTRTINDSMPYADIPIDIIQSELGITPEDGLLFDTYIQIHANNALNGTLVGPDGAGIRYRQILPDKRESLFGLHFEIMEDVFDGKRDLRLVVTYQVGRYSTSLVRAILAEINSAFALLDDAGAADRKLEACFL
jgi:acyl carrier protein